MIFDDDRLAVGALDRDIAAGGSLPARPDDIAILGSGVGDVRVLSLGRRRAAACCYGRRWKCPCGETGTPL